jgi:DNA-binding NarL/FixJ family response regulator
LECRSLQAQFLLYSARGREALDLVESVLDHPQAPDAARVRALAAAFALWSGLGQGERIHDYGEEWFAVARRVRGDVPFGELQLRMTRALALIWTGRYVAAEQFAGADLGLQARHAPPALRGILEGLKGGSAYYRGHMAEAQGRLDASFRALSEGDWFGLRPWAGAFQVRAAVFAGDTDGARGALERAGAAYEANAIRSAFALPDLELSRAWVDAGEGMRSRAVDRCRSLATVLDKMLVPIAGDALHAIARLGRPDEVVVLLEALADSCDSRVVRAYADHARALTEDDAPGLDAAGQRFEGLGADLLAAEAFRSAANRYVASGRGPAAHAAARRCEMLLRTCGRPTSPALEPEALFGEQLTEREREVATLAAQGLMSQEIAERLHLSVRTVDTHLSRAYRKLMVDGRHDLGEALGVQPISRPRG